VTDDGVAVLPVRGIDEVVPGTDLAEVITSAAPWLRDGDILVVTSKIVSKSEGQLVDVPTSGPERESARADVLAAETARSVARRGHTRIVQTHHGFVMASAGIDASNVDRSQLVLLPKDPDASARGLRAALRERFGLDVAVIISDTMGRPWRNGLTDVALGAAGLDAIRDYRGELDPYGNEMQVTQVAVVDELSAAGDLVKGKFDRVPVAVVRGYPVSTSDGDGAAILVRDAQHDLFSMGTAEARAAGLTHAATLTDGAFAEEPAEDVEAAVARALALVRVAPTTIVDPVPPDPGLPAGTVRALRVHTRGPASAQVALGIDVHRLRCALAAEGLASTWLPDDAVLAVGTPPL
jgi:coenzyme F420-0:L-glutamate ligase/coenzyme F420-1:gamma-L-glutamate ligase